MLSGSWFGVRGSWFVFWGSGFVGWEKMRALKESSVLFSQPSATTSTPPAFGWRQSAASRFAVISWSAPSCEQP